MKITFPHMGNIYLPVKAMFEELGVEIIIPPKNSKKTLEIGTKYAPESMCLPMKINLGNYIQSIEKGADTIVVAGSSGPCRFGYFEAVEKEILKDLGYDVEFIILEAEAPDANLKEFYHRLSRITHTKNIFKIMKAFKNGIAMLKRLDQMEHLLLQKRPYEKYKGQMDEIYNRCIKELEHIPYTGMINTLKKAQTALESVELVKREDVLKVGIVGEIYTNIDDFTNLDIGKKLNDLGVEVYKSHTPYKWIKEHMFFNSLGSTGERAVYHAAMPYIKTMVGGHGRETIGNSILYHKMGADGLIQLLPFTCMPEIIAMDLLKNVQKDLKIPILTLIIDEMTGEAGYMTRLEAYIDLLRNRRDKIKNEKMLSRC